MTWVDVGLQLFEPRTDALQVLRYPPPVPAVAGRPDAVTAEVRVVRPGTSPELRLAVPGVTT